MADGVSPDVPTNATTVDVIEWAQANAQGKRPKVRKGFQKIPEGGIEVVIGRLKRQPNSTSGGPRSDLPPVRLVAPPPPTPEQAVE